MASIKSRLLTATWTLLWFGVASHFTRAELPAVAYAPGTDGRSRVVDITQKNTHRLQVLARLGPPDATLSTDVWVYWNYRGSDSISDKLDTVVVAFANDRVTAMKLAPREAVQAALAAHARRVPADALRQPLYALQSNGRYSPVRGAVP